MSTYYRVKYGGASIFDILSDYALLVFPSLLTCLYGRRQSEIVKVLRLTAVSFSFFLVPSDFEYPVIVPAAFRRPLMVKKVHSSHIGIDSFFLRKARDVLFCPGMSAEIMDSIGDTCKNNQQEELLIPHDSPKRP